MRIAILISGSGTTAEAIIQSAQKGILTGLVTPVVVIASTNLAAGIQRVEALGIPTVVIDRAAFSSQEEFGSAILAQLKDKNVEFVSQNGWLPLTPKNIVRHFTGNIINQHPGPLDPGFPDFGGKGMFGARPTCARVIYSMLAQEDHPWTEAVTHMVTEEFDRGQLLRVVQVPFNKTDRRIREEDITNSLPVQEYIKTMTKNIQEKLLPIEHKNVIDTLYKLATDTLVPYAQEKRVIIPGTQDLLAKAKALAIKLFPEG